MNTTLLLLRNSGQRRAVCIRSTSVMINEHSIECAVAWGHVTVTGAALGQRVWNGELYENASVYADTPKMLEGLRDEFTLELVGFETPADLAREISEAAARLHEMAGDQVSDHLGMSISHITESFHELAKHYES